jgi:S1-C subfamily serine protease
MAYAEDAQPPGAGGISTTAKLALGLAGVAVLVVVIAVIVVATRGSSGTAVAGGSARAPIVADGPEIIVVDARDVVRMDRGTVEPVTDPSGVVGVRINDPELLATLRLESTDVITAISGKAVRRQFDVNDALAGAGLANATTLYVELVRGGAPVLVKWELEGDLREARTGVSGRMSRLPPTPLAPDPLSDTIKRITDFEFELPRTTMMQISTNVQSGMSLGVRPVPAIRNGLVEGVKLYAIRPGSVWAALGLKNGDSILSVNGRPLSMTNLGDEFERAKNESVLDASVMRRGNVVALRYAITK